STFHPPRWVGLTAHSAFSGKEADDEVGLDYFGARYYHPALGRWASADPLTIHRVGANLDPYSYVSGDVIHAVDPKGLQACIGAEICFGGADGALSFPDFGLGGGGGSSSLGLFSGLFGGGSKPVPRLPDPVAPSGSGTKPFDPGANMSGVQRWIWGGSGSFHDIVTSDRNWKALQYYYGAVAITAGTIATGGYLLEALGTAEAAAGTGALFARAGPAIGSTVAALHTTGALDPLEQEAEQEFQAALPALQMEAQALTARLSQLQSAMHPAAANGGRTLGILRTTRFDVVGAGVRDLSPALRDATTDYEVAAKLFGEHAEPTVMVAADRLMQIFPGDFVPRILVTTVNICPQCVFLIQASGGLLISPRAAIWRW
ncbi:MAG: RHS repeat-associated core domain-containing protein, partial [Gammaproteobacteria bacterium]